MFVFVMHLWAFMATTALAAISTDIFNRDGDDAATAVFGRPELNCEVVVIVPSTFAAVIPMREEDRRATVAGVQRMLAELCGGSTMVEGHGMYVSVQQSLLIEERVSLVLTSLDASSVNAQHILTEIRALAQWLATTLCQESIMVKVNNRAYFVAPLQKEISNE